MSDLEIKVLKIVRLKSPQNMLESETTDGNSTWTRNLNL